jgi:hypothetical protein
MAAVSNIYSRMSVGAKHLGGGDADRSRGGLDPEIDAREQSGFPPASLEVSLCPIRVACGLGCRRLVNATNAQSTAAQP